MTDRSPGEITAILADLSRGDEAAAVTLLPVVYDELRALAGSFFERQQPGHTLQPTALVHEAFLKLVRRPAGGWEDRAHFFAVAARAMRQILADHARRKRAAKRGGGSRHRVTLTGLDTPPAGERDIDLIALDEALSRLSELSPRQGQIVEMRFLAGLDECEVAQVLGVTPRTIQREWRLAKAFLRCELSGESVS